MTWVVPLALGGFAILLMATFTMISSRRRHHAHAAPAHVAGPRILVHDINDDRCTGCDACVAVCPTNVLDLVSNKSRVLRFEDCIQCEACMFACPTEALVMFPEGSHPPPLKVPEIDENFMTAVPGQYLIGEVAGKPLVKSAANLGRAVVEHMLLTGLRPGALGPGGTTVDVAIVGSGPGGLSAALTCIARGLTYVVLEKEQLIASTIARYPKGKLVMAEPYDTINLSLLPVFDSSKEQLIPIWNELLQRVGMAVRLGESVESVQYQHDTTFEIRTTVATYRAQRVVLSIGTRGKPRTLQVPGENLPKVFNLLEDPDEWQGRNVLVVGGGDSACEAALALADAGARVILSYRGKSFSRAAPKNKQAIEQYAGEGRIKAKMMSQVLAFDHETVTIALADGTQKRYPNDGAFVLIGADPPVAWLEKMGIRFVERPHQYQLGKTDDMVRRFVRLAMPCAEDAARAAAAILGGSTGIEPPGVGAVSLPMPMGQPVSGPRKWLRSATSIFSTRGGSRVTPLPVKSENRARGGQPSRRLDAPVPLSEFAKKPPKTGVHSGDGRRDQLSAGERTRILRMLRDEGGRMADEDSQVFYGAPPRRPESDFDDSDIAPPPSPSRQMPAAHMQTQKPVIYPTPAASPSARAEVNAKPAVVVGLAQANSRKKRQSGAPSSSAGPPPMPAGRKPPTMPPPIPSAGPPPMPPGPPRARPPATLPPPTPRPNASTPRRELPRPFEEDKRTVVDDGNLPRGMLTPNFDAPTRVAHQDEARRMFDDHDDRSGPGDPFAFVPSNTQPGQAPEHLDEPSGPLTDSEDEATRMANVDNFARLERANRGQPVRHEERTRAVDIKNDPKMNDIDWDID